MTVCSCDALHSDYKESEFFSYCKCTIAALINLFFHISTMAEPMLLSDQDDGEGQSIDSINNTFIFVFRY